jgi:4'-phosphopantetheinyl transferase EntD
MQDSLNRSLFPDGVVLETLEDLTLAEELSIPEQALVAKAVPKRVNEFRAGRHCARQALRRLGIEGFDLLAGPNREPLWPSGVVGSISHSDHYAVAAVAAVGNIQSLGIDIEQAKPLAQGMLKIVATHDEIQMINGLSADKPWDALLFSAKEAFYKAWFPLTGSKLDFHDVLVTFLPSESQFQVRILTDDGLLSRNVSGRFLFSHDLIWTSTTVTT